MRIRDLYPVAVIGAGSHVANKIRNRWFWDIGQGVEVRLIQIEFGFNQTGGVIAETYLTGGMALEWGPIGLTRVHQLIPLRPGTQTENTPTTDFAARGEWNAQTQKLLIYNMEVSNNENTNGNDISNMKFTFMALGR